MNSHPFLDDELRERAALYVLTALEERDERAFRLHLVACATCLAEVDALGLLARDLALAGPSVTPPPALFDRVLARVRSAPESLAAEADRRSLPVWKTWTADADGADSTGAGAQDLAHSFHFVGADAGGWEPSGFAGIEARRLSVDPANDRVTFLARMAPGTAYPAHVHKGVEECYVLAGELCVGDLRMRAGDYQRADAGSVHGVQATEAGCLLLIVSSLEDEILG